MRRPGTSGTSACAGCQIGAQPVAGAADPDTGVDDLGATAVVVHRDADLDPRSTRGGELIERTHRNHSGDRSAGDPRLHRVGRVLDGLIDPCDECDVCRPCDECDVCRRGGR